jgi:hypothetical protein
MIYDCSRRERFGNMMFVVYERVVINFRATKAQNMSATTKDQHRSMGSVIASAAWIGSLLAWVSLAVVADIIRVECTSSEHCGSGNECSNRVCVCADQEEFLKRAYRCGDNGYLISNWADWVGLGTGIVSFISFMVLVYRYAPPRETDVEPHEVLESRDLLVFTTTIVLIALGIILIVASCYWIPQHAKFWISSVALLSFASAFFVLFFVPPLSEEEDAKRGKSRRR